MGWCPRVWRCPLSLLQAGRWGPGSAAPCPWNVERGRWGRICVRHRGLLRLAYIPWVSVVRARQVDAVLAGVSVRQVVL